MKKPENVDPIADLSTAMNFLNQIRVDLGNYEHPDFEIKAPQHMISRVVDLLHPTYLYLQALEQPKPIPMLLWCPQCNERHLDLHEFATRVHHTHACQTCGMVWRPAVVPTVGVRFLPGFKDTDQ